MPILTFAIICLATWNLSSLLVVEDGPFSIFAIIRYWMGVDMGPDMRLYKRYGIGTFRDFTAELFMCVWCMSRWVAGILVILYFLFPAFIFAVCAILAVSTVVILIQDWIDSSE